MTWDSKSDSVPPEQRIYARWLAAGSNLTFALLVTAFIIYSAGVVPPWVPLAELPNYWGLSADRFAAATGSPKGWHWLQLASRSDGMNVVGIACVALVTPVCFARLVPELVRQREHTFAAIALMELWILVVAASGIAAG